MPKIIVEIEWTDPDDPEWFDAQAIENTLEAMWDTNTSGITVKELEEDE